jgi:hypothetical protein
MGKSCSLRLSRTDTSFSSSAFVITDIIAPWELAFESYGIGKTGNLDRGLYGLKPCWQWKYLAQLIEYYSLWRFEQEEARNFSFCCFAREPNLY